MKRSILFRNLIIALVVVFSTMLAMHKFSSGPQYLNVSASSARSILSTDTGIDSVVIQDRSQVVQIALDHSLVFRDSHGHEQESKLVEADFPRSGLADLYNLVRSSHAKKWTTNLQQPSTIGSIVQAILPTIIISVLIMFFLGAMVRGGGRGGLMGIGRSKAKKFNKDNVKTTFADVAGSEEAIEELEEIKDFLKFPQKYDRFGAKIPRGVLLYGPPGTGKTLLARAVAGEAGVPFFHVSGSDFIEMFAGVGSARIRDLFEQAKNEKPSIIFIDELDAIGRKRGTGGFNGSDDERHQTLNQMLVEMDGFEVRDGVIVIAATNRPDSLDPALLRPGRFDRQIPVNNPTLQGRKDILRVHAKGKPLASDADLSELAKRTLGMSGAELENVLNEAALLTARENRDSIDWETLNEAIDRVQLGPRRRSRVISEHEKKVAAYHEAGHILAAWATPGTQPVYKVTIVQRGNTGGHAMTLPDDDKLVYSRTELLGNIIMSLGGRVAEELVFGEQTTGASSDIEQATKTARSMITEYGMSTAAGPIMYGKDDDDDSIFSNSAYRGSNYSGGVATTIDTEVQKIMQAAHDEAWELMVQYRDILDQLVEELLEKETLVKTDLERIFAPITKRPRLKIFNDFGSFRPSGRIPVLTPQEKSHGEHNGRTHSFSELNRLDKFRDDKLPEQDRSNIIKHDTDKNK